MSYKIKEVAEKINLPTSTLLYYEQENILPAIKRDENGNRIYDDADVAWLELVTCLRKTNIPLSELKAISLLSRQGIGTIQERIRLLEMHKDNIIKQQQELQDTLKKLDKKINYYKNF